MTVREYIGARYIPLFMGAWDNTKTYEPLSIVEYQGNSYTSRQAVPTGIAITNEVYWAETGNYNAQIEAYRQEVLAFDGRIDALEAITYPLSYANGGTNANSKANAKANLDFGTAEMNTAIIPMNGSINTYSIATKVTNANNSTLNNKQTLLAPDNTGLVFYNSTDQETIWEIRPYARHKAILFGDSYLREVTDFRVGWGVAFERESGFNVIHKYRSGGAGWKQEGINDTYAGMNFVDMLNQSIQDYSSIERASVDYIVVNGGINDISGGFTQEDIVAAINNFTTIARTNYPNAKIVVGFAMCSKTYEQSAIARYLNTYMNLSASSGVIYAKNSNSWFLGREDYYAADASHPNDSGLYYMGKLLARCAMGDCNVANSIIFSASKLTDIIEAQIPTFSDWAELDTQSNIILINNMYECSISVHITDASAMPSTGDTQNTVYLPINTYNMSGFVGNAAVVKPGAAVLTRHNAAGRSATLHQTSIGPSNVYILLTPATNTGSGVMQYTNDCRIAYQFTVPLA